MFWSSSSKRRGMHAKGAGCLGTACLILAAGMALAPELLATLLPIGFGILGIGFLLMAWTAE